MEGPRNAVWDDRPAEYDAVRDVWLNERRTRFVAAWLGEARAGAHVVELGTGTGWLLLRLAAARPDLRFTGVEPLEGYVGFARSRAEEAGLSGRVAFVQGTAETLGDVVREPVDRLLSNDVLHHVDDVPAGLRAAAGVAGPDARWLAIEPNATNPYVWAMHTLRGGERPFYARRFVRDAAAARWELRARTPLFLVPPQVRVAPPWAVAAERRLERVRPLAGGVAFDLALRPA